MINNIKKIVYYVAGILIAILVFCESNTFYPKLTSLFMIIMVVYMGISKKIISKDYTDIYICKKNTKQILSIEEKEKIIKILSQERGHINFNRDYIYDDHILVIISHHKQTLLYFGISSEGNETIKINKGFYNFKK